MTLTVRCKCGKRLRLSEKAAGRTVACPHCRRSFRIPADRFRAAGRQSTPDDPAAGAPPPRPMELDVGPSPSPVADAGSNLELLDDFATDADVASPSGPPPPPRVVTIETETELDYAAGDTKRATGTDDAVQGPHRGYWADVLASLAYPFWSIGNGMNFIGIVVLVALMKLLPFVLAIPCYGLILGLIGFVFMFGWWCAFNLSVTRDTSAGSDDMPGLMMRDGIIEDILKPAFLYIGAHAVCLGPAALLSIAIAAGWVPSGAAFAVPFIIALGVFLIPITLLLFSMGAVAAAFRVDLVMTTIARTILPYLAMWGMLLVVTVARLASVAPDVLIDLGLEALVPSSLAAGFLGGMFLVIADVYFTIVSMRFIGLYYLHFKRRFAFTFE